MTKKRKHSGKAESGAGIRDLSVKVKTAKKRKLSSTLWLQRQLNDPYVKAAQRDGYRSRAAYKLIEIDDKYGLIQPGSRIIDLGAAPGGWSQIAAQRSGAVRGKGTVIAIDLSAIEAIQGVEFIQCDFMDAAAPQMISQALGEERADLVLSDMAAPATGHRQTDHLRIMGLCEAAFEFACEILAPDGVFLAKVLQGGTEDTLLNLMKHSFKTVRHVKPKASRADSSELYVLATGFRGGLTTNYTNGP